MENTGRPALGETYFRDCVEFPAVDPRCGGGTCRYGDLTTDDRRPRPRGPPSGYFDRPRRKFDLRGDGDDAFADAWTLPENFWLVSEPTVVPKSDGRLGDGVWVLVFGTSTAPARQKTHVYVLDGEDLASGPACVVELPGAGLPYGLHSCWVDGAELAQ